MVSFRIASTARQPGEEAPDRLFVGETEPHNAERPWLAIRGVAISRLALPVAIPVGAVVTAEPRLTISVERP